MTDFARMNIGEVEATISQFNNDKVEFESVVNKLGNIMSNLTATWTGEASRAFEGRLTDMRGSLNTILDSMDGSTNKLREAIQAYQATEEAQVSGINAVNSQVTVPFVQG